MKFLIWLVIGLAIVVWLQRAKRNLLRRARDAAAAGQAGGAAEAPRGRRAPPAGATPAIENMVQCAHCGIHFPMSEAVHGSSATLFCCSEHRELHALESGAS
jgi:uncharacterized protein